MIDSIIGSNRRADLINERIDLTMRKLDRARRILVASPSLVERTGGLNCVEELADLPTLAMTSWVSFHGWELIAPNDAKRVIRHQPRLTCRSMTAILDAARAGLGFGLLLESACEADLQAGKLVRVLPDWQSEESPFILSSRPPRACRRQREC